MNQTKKSGEYFGTCAVPHAGVVIGGRLFLNILYRERPQKVGEM